MVIEHRYLFGVEDIGSIVFACTNCRQEVTCRVDGQFKPPNHCTGCRRELMTRATDPNSTLLLVLREILQLSNPAVRDQFAVPKSE